MLAASAVLLAGLGAGPALAAPAAPPHAASTAAAATQTTLKQKVEAGAVLGVLVDAKLAGLGDRDFVFALWQRALKDKPEMKEVRASAELALLNTDAACTLWITTEIFQARDRDHANIVRDENEALIARQRKQKAAATIGIEAQPEELVVNYQNFVYWLANHPKAGPKVREGALKAWGGTDADRITFLDNDLLKAHQLDQDNENEAKRDRNAKSNAAGVLAIVATEGQLNLSWANFTTFIWDQAGKIKKDSEVTIAAETAVRSLDENAQKAFVYKGIHEANARDRIKAIEKQDAENLQRLRELKVRVENSRMQPALAAAAAKALAGTPDDVRQFLLVGQYDDALRRQALQATTNWGKVWYAASEGGGATIIAGDPNGGVPGTPLPGTTWKIREGLADANCFSLESATTAGSFLRQKELRVQLAPSDGSSAFKLDATWCSRPQSDGTGVSLESKSSPGRFMRHFNGEIWAANNSGGDNPFDAADLFAQDTTWAVVAPDPVVTKPGGKAGKSDYDGDGRDDIAAFYDYDEAKAKLWVWRGTESGFATGPEKWTSAPGAWNSNQAQYVPGDFNGDGRGDIAAFHDYGNAHTKLWLWRGTPTGLEPGPEVWDGQPSNWDTNRAKYVAGDFNGDGRDDIAAYYDYGNAHTKLWLWRGTPTGLESGPEVWDGQPSNWDTNRAKYVAGDFNGDGRDDIAAYYDYGNAHTRLWLWRGTESGFTTGPEVWDGQPSNWDTNRAKYVAGDFNGDGRDDIAAYYDYGNGTTKLWLWRATESGFTTGPEVWGSTGWWMERADVV
ncbi:hypothetical protein ALI144C_19085 [Actinosynnema sp. ALI-1.44]|nr:hypothetical protein ALI144C_19085 [Actinosynnema sp. ALI-1.44]